MTAPYTIAGSGRFRNIESEEPGRVTWFPGRVYTLEVKSRREIIYPESGGDAAYTGVIYNTQNPYTVGSESESGLLIASDELSDFTPLKDLPDGWDVIYKEPPYENQIDWYATYSQSPYRGDYLKSYFENDEVRPDSVEASSTEIVTNISEAYYSLHESWQTLSCSVNADAEAGMYLIPSYETTFQWSFTYYPEEQYSKWAWPITNDGSSVVSVSTLSVKIIRILPEKAVLVNPEPTGVSDIAGNASLMWEDGGLGQSNAATGFDVYFSDSQFGLAKIGDSLGYETVTMTPETANLGNYSAGKTYYWRVDSFNDYGLTTGDVWSFTVHSEVFPEPRGGEYDETGVSTLGGGRYNQFLVAVGHKAIYYGPQISGSVGGEEESGVLKEYVHDDETTYSYCPYTDEEYVWAYAQTFIAESDHQVSSVKLALQEYDGSPNTGNVTVSIMACDENHLPTGDVLATVTVDTPILPEDWTEEFPMYEFTFETPMDVTEGTEYAIIVSSDSYDGVDWMYTEEVEYAGLQLSGYSADGEPTDWEVYDGADFLFEVYT